jgi:FkbM family methyltransferase
MIIYDLGAHNGSDLPYYLEKADKVIAVEANPQLANHISYSFSNAVSAGRLVVENVAITDNSSVDQLKFWLNKESDVLSSLVPPKSDQANYHTVFVPGLSIEDLILRYGDPWFIKIDLEGLDTRILRELFRLGIFPEFISVEGHSLDVMGVLSGIGNYNAFKLQYGNEIGVKFKDFHFMSREGRSLTYSFPNHSAGPFGEDLPQPWVGVNEVYDTISLVGPGWWDLHARIVGDNLVNPPPRFRLNWVIRRALHVYLRSRYPSLSKIYECGIAFLRSMKYR